MREGMKGKAGIGKLALYGREYLVAVQPRENGLVMYTLRHAKEVRSMDAIDELQTVPAKVKPDEIKLAKQVIENFEGDAELGRVPRRVPGRAAADHRREDRRRGGRGDRRGGAAEGGQPDGRAAPEPRSRQHRARRRPPRPTIGREAGEGRAEETSRPIASAPRSVHETDRLTGRTLGLLVIFAIAAYLCWLMLRPFVGVLMWAIVLVVVFYPAHRRLEAWTGNPGSAAALSTLLVIVTILLPVVGVTFAVAHELQRRGRASARAASGTSSTCPALQPAVRWLDRVRRRRLVAVDRLRRRSPPGVERGHRRPDADVRRRHPQRAGADAARRLHDVLLLPRRASRCATRSTTSCRSNTSSRTTS